jgi:adenylosuccinate lyase
MQDLALDVEEIAHRLEALRFRGCQGTTGTQASFLELFGGDHGKVRELERRVTAKLGFREQFAVTGQTYPRKADSMVLDALSGVAQSAAKMAGDLRLLQHEGELLEPFESEQIGSSAMAYKRNPMRAERIAGLARFVISLQANGAHTAASQWLERTLDDSANRRLTLPEAFLGTDAILILATNIAAGLEVREEAIARHVAEQMPFMATERWLMLGVGAGGDRQALHEVIRQHSLAVSEAVSRGAPNDLLERLAADPAFRGVPSGALRAELEPAGYTGRAPQQVGEFLDEYLHPLLERARPLAAETGGAEVRV